MTANSPLILLHYTFAMSCGSGEIVPFRGAVHVHFYAGDTIPGIN